MYGALGLLLGLYQMGGYRRPNTWLNLLHRPLAPWQHRGGARAAPARCCSRSAILLPLLVVAGWQEWHDRARGRHAPPVADRCRRWLVAPVRLSRRLLTRCSPTGACGFCAGVFLCLVRARRSDGPRRDRCCSCWRWRWLRGDGAGRRSSPTSTAAPRGVARTVVVARAAADGDVVRAACWSASAWSSCGSRRARIPTTCEVPQAGGEKEAENAEGKDVMRMGLRDSRDPRSAAVARAGRAFPESSNVAPGAAHRARARPADEPGADGIRRRRAPHPLGVQPRHDALRRLQPGRSASRRARSAWPATRRSPRP